MSDEELVPVGWAFKDKWSDSLEFDAAGDEPSTRDIERAAEFGDSYVPLFTADQLKQAEQRAYERAAQVCDELEYADPARHIRALMSASTD
jgi:hypothetical protein